MFTRTLAKKVTMIVALTTASYFVFATSGGGNKKAKSSTKAVTAKTVYKPLSLRSGFSFNGNKLLSLAPEKQQVIQLTSVATVKRGDKTYVVPVQHKVGVKPGQITTVKNQKYLEVRLLNINLNQ